MWRNLIRFHQQNEVRRSRFSHYASLITPSNYINRTADISSRGPNFGRLFEDQNADHFRLLQTGARWLTNCTMTNVMHKFLIYLSVYFRLTCFGFLAHLQRQLYKFGSGSSLLDMVSVSGRWHHTQETWTSAEAAQCLWRWTERKPETCKAEVNRWKN
jgi:hypothetical protein